MAQRDWYDWHAFYDDPGSGLSRRLSWVQDQIRAALDAAPPGPIRAISLCAGQGRDLIGVLADHPRRADVTARLVELDPRNTEVAARLAAEAGLAQVEIVTGDASLTSQYADLGPADLVLACGLFGNMTDADVGSDDRLLRPALRRERHGRLDPRPLGAGPGPADLRLVRGARLRASVAVSPELHPVRRRAPPHRPARPAGPRRRHVHLHQPQPQKPAPPAPKPDPMPAPCSGEVAEVEHGAAGGAGGLALGHVQQEGVASRCLRRGR